MKDRRYTIDECKEIFNNFFQDTEYKNKIIALADTSENPDCGLEIDYNDLEKYFEDGSLTHILDDLFDYPKRILFGMEIAINDLLHPDQKGKVTIHPRPINLPKDKEKSVSEIRQIDIGKLIRTTGMIKSIRQNTPKIVKGIFKCLRCGTTIEQPQPTDSLSKKDPLQCYKDQGGCDRTQPSTSFELLSESSEYRDLQMLRFEEMYDSNEPHQTQDLRVFLWDDLVGMNPVNEVIINGIVKTLQIKKTSVPEVYLEAVSIELPEEYYSAINLTEDDVKEILEVMHDPDIYNKLIDSVAPGIKGYRNIKEAIVLDLFGGVDRTVGGTFHRGKIHILIIGDPSTAKSMLLMYATKLAPISRYSSCEGATGVGLTFAVVKDEFDKRWVVEIGLLPMANGGVVGIDEIDKLPPEELLRIHGVMESGELHCDKAGIHRTYHAYCSIIAGGNPKDERFEPADPLYPQINLKPAMISRFDLVFGITDTYRGLDDEMPDKEIVDFIGSLHMDDGDMDSLELEPPIPPKLYRKILRYAWDNIKPKLTPEAHIVLRDYFLTLRKVDDKDKAPLTMRQFQGLIRLAEAKAKTRFSDIVTVEDANCVIDLFRSCLFCLVREDFDLLATGIEKCQRDRLRLLRNYIKETSPTFSEMLEFAKANKIDEDACKTDIQKLWNEGRIYNTKGVYNIIK